MVHPLVLGEDSVAGMVLLLLQEEDNGVLLPLLVHQDSFLPGEHRLLRAMEEEEDFHKELHPGSSGLHLHRLLQEDLENQALEPPCLHHPLVLKAGHLPLDLQLGELLQALLHLQDLDQSLLPPLDEELLPPCPPTGLLKEALGAGRTNLPQEDRMLCPTFWVHLPHPHHRVKKRGDGNCT